jgi:hypothetical protein
VPFRVSFTPAARTALPVNQIVGGSEPLTRRNKKNGFGASMLGVVKVLFATSKVIFEKSSSILGFVIKMFVAILSHRRTWRFGPKGQNGKKT